MGYIVNIKTSQGYMAIPLQKEQHSSSKMFLGGEMAQWSKVLATLTKDMGSNTHASSPF